MVSFTRRLVRTSTRRTDSKSSLRFMLKVPPWTAHHPNSRNLTDRPIRNSELGLLSAFDLRISGFSSRHRHCIKDLFYDRISRNRLRFGLVGQNQAMPQ